VIQHSNNFQTPTAEKQNVQRTQAAQDLSQTDRICFAYGERGHYVNQCYNMCTHPPQTVASTLAPTHGANSVPVATKQNYARGRVNNLAVEEAHEAPVVVLGILFINATSTVVLFSSRASHSFIYVAYVEKHNLPIPLLKCQMIVSSPGGGRDMPIRQLCPKVDLKIRG
jgi:hypothetical protein